MILIVSDNERFTAKCVCAAESIGVIPAVNKTGLPVPFPFALVYADVSDTAACSALCRDISYAYPGIKIIAAVKRSARDPVNYLDVSGSDHQINLPCSDETFAELLADIITPAFTVNGIEFTGTRRGVIYNGYELKLSGVQYAILRSVAKYGSIGTAPLLDIAGKISENNLAVQLSRINAKAKVITGRKIVSRPYNASFCKLEL